MRIKMSAVAATVALTASLGLFASTPAHAAVCDDWFPAGGAGWTWGRVDNTSGCQAVQVKVTHYWGAGYTQTWVGPESKKSSYVSTGGPIVFQAFDRVKANGRWSMWWRY